jgi:hypothetical protein
VAFFLLHPTLTLITTLAIGALFTFSGGIKLFDLRGWRAIIIGYGLLPIRLARIAGTAHPFVELLNGLVLLSVPWLIPAGARRIVSVLAGAHAAAILLTATLFVLAAMARRQKMSNCGCFGTAIKVPLGWHKVAENAAWLLLCIQIVLANLLA